MKLHEVKNNQNKSKTATTENISYTLNPALNTYQYLDNRTNFRGIPWTSDTLTCSFSMGKGLAALGLALLHSRGHLNYDEKVG